MEYLISKFVIVCKHLEYKEIFNTLIRFRSYAISVGYIGCAERENTKVPYFQRKGKNYKQLVF